ncbi:hypothetical protein [Mucilaginibacter sp. AK015]|uniref:hypothetical protein n=1 Tax=Mucilaginibacter sp. AK015 TaxID=2723072 RepID=UPI001608756A|nr:hypothetical protein [Mucilaginibacter sp. AK015]MBB5396144.1 hypothetical protein [Mucilaginibacter sp. AK015]
MIQSNQKSSQQKGFFAAQGFTPQIVQNHGLETFAPRFAAQASRFSKISYALATLKATMFCPLSAEAVLLTGQEKTK